MSGGIGTGDITLSTSIQNTEVVGAQNKKQGDSGTVLNKILSKLADGRDFIFGKLAGKMGALITIGQVGGSAAMLLGGVALIFSGIAANLTVGGIPLGIPLLAGGAALFAAGTGLLIAKLVADPNSTLGQKIKDFVTITGKNTFMGVITGSLASGLFSLASPAAIVAGITAVVASKEKVCETAQNVFTVADKINDYINPNLGANGKSTAENQVNDTRLTVQQKKISEISSNLSEGTCMVKQLDVDLCAKFGYLCLCLLLSSSN